MTQGNEQPLPSGPSCWGIGLFASDYFNHSQFLVSPWQLSFDVFMWKSKPSTMQQHQRDQEDEAEPGTQQAKATNKITHKHVVLKACQPHHTVARLSTSGSCCGERANPAGSPVESTGNAWAVIIHGIFFALLREWEQV
jgi:hypothetical protein